MRQKNRKRVAIFGLGLLGRRLARSLRRRGAEVLGYSRSSYIGRGCVFDAGQEEDCRIAVRSMLRPDVLFITFPPQEAHPAFWEMTANMGDQRLLLGSTGIYHSQARVSITEESALRTAHERYPMEDLFLRSGGTLVRLASTYGDLRNPVRWIQQGRVGYDDRQANLVHYDDVVDALLSLTKRVVPATVYNLSDGQDHTWQAIVDALIADGWLFAAPSRSPAKKVDALVDNKRFSLQFPDFSFRDFWQELPGLATTAFGRKKQL